MALTSVSIAVDRDFWPAAARAVCEFGAGLGVPARELQSITWLVPAAAHGPEARRGLRAAISGAFVPPRVVPWSSWIGRAPDSGIAVRAELFAVLRANAWVREAFGEQPAALWALARGVAQLCDELTLAAVDQPQAFAERLQAALARHFSRRAARAVQPQAQLVLQLWRARRADDPALQVLQALDQRAAAAREPLVFLADTAFATEAGGWKGRFLQRYALRAPVLLIEPDIAAALAARPLLAAAWPELAGGDVSTPIAARADFVEEVAPPLHIVGASSLEDEARAVAQQVLDWRAAGVTSIALVALDRLTARRARALLERAEIVVRDETGWKLSTTSAAAAVMRWFDLVADNLYWRDLIDWLKSPFTLSGRADKAGEIGYFERAIRAGGTLQGAAAMRRALAAAERGASADDVKGAREILALIEAQMAVTRRAWPTLAAHLQALQAALDALGMRAALAADAVGAEVLRELDDLRRDLAAVAANASLPEFRALLAERFEEAAFVDRRVESPVVMVSLAAAALRPFDAVLLVGADVRHLPSVPDELLFMSNAVRAELGLATAETALRAQAAQLAAVLTVAPRVLATWRVRHGDEANSLSPLLERLAFVARRALSDDLARTAEHPVFDVAASAALRPAPGAPQLLPATISASAAQSLVDCGYQFYARRLLRLDALDDVIEMPDKRDFGEALHAVLRRFHVQWADADFSRVDTEALSQSLLEHAQAIFEPLIARAAGFLAFRRRFDGLVGDYVAWLQQRAALGWRWRAAEEDFRRPLALADGRTVDVTGRIDRLDEHADANVCVLDYKARAADVLKRGLNQAGEDVQLPLYGLLLAGRAQSAAYVSFDRARRDRQAVQLVLPPQPFAELVETVMQRLHTDVQRIADGAPLPAIGVRSVCDRCEMRGLCRRDYWEHGEGESDEPQAGGGVR